MLKTCLLLLSSCFILELYGQYQIGIIPRVSPDKAIYQKIGYTEVEIRYGSPSVNNRQIWGDLVPFGKVWRAGANAATILENSLAIDIGGKTLDSGKYAFFLIPREHDTWTAIFNKVSNQWGAFSYEEKEDALRLEVRPRKTRYKTEDLSYSIRQTGFSYGSIVLSWDYLEVEVPFSTHYLDEFERKIEQRANAQPEYIKWIPYLQGAEYLVQLYKQRELARTWIHKAEQLMGATQEWNKEFYPRPYVEGHVYWTKAKILAWEGNYKEAVVYVEKLKNMESATFYEKKNEAEGIDSQYEIWKAKY